MWFYIVAVAILLAGIIGTFATGGIFTIVLLPLGLIGVVSAVGYRALGHAAQVRQGGGASGSPLPHSSPGEPGHVPTTPEGLADARRAQQ